MAARTGKSLQVLASGAKKKFSAAKLVLSRLPMYLDFLVRFLGLGLPIGSIDMHWLLKLKCRESVGVMVIAARLGEVVVRMLVCLAVKAVRASC